MNIKKTEKNYMIELCIKDESNRIVAWQVGMSEKDIKDMLKRHIGWRRSSAHIER